MALQNLNIQDFSGGIATISEKKDIAFSAKFTKGLSPFEDPAHLVNSKKTTKVSGTTVTDLIHWMQDGSPWDTNRYFLSSGGKIYRETNAAIWSSLRTVTGCAGEGLLVHDNYLYYALDTDIGRYGPLDNSPAFTDAFTSWWLAADLQTTGGGTGQDDYVPPTTIAETAAARQTFTPDHDPITSVVINVDVVGTGNWTVTVHDYNNRVIGSKTIAVASVVVGDNTFTFAAPLRVQPGEEYHFHVTSTVADGGVDTDVDTDLEGAYYIINFAPLISADFHPMTEMLGGWVIGNERYIGFFDNVDGEYDPTRVELAAGFEVRNITKYNEFVVVEAWKGQSFSEAEGIRRYYWDGNSPTYNYFEEITAGGPNAVSTYRKQLVGIYGNRGSVYSGEKAETKLVDHIPKLARGKKVEIYPGAIDEYEERLVIGIAASTDDGTALEQGVYEFGNQAEGLPFVLSYPYLISTGTTQATTLKIGSVRAFGKDLYIGWRDDTSYGVDKVSASDSAIAAGLWESRIFDADDAAKFKQAIKLQIEFEALTVNQTVTPKYKLERAASFTTGDAIGVGETQADVYINSLYKEIEFGFDFTSTSNTFLVIKSLSFVYNDLTEEELDA
jgi:hypothetical protein